MNFKLKPITLKKPTLARGTKHNVFLTDAEGQ